MKIKEQPKKSAKTRFAQLVERHFLNQLGRDFYIEGLKMGKSRTVLITNEVRVLKYMRIEAGLSLRKASQRLSITDCAISHIENGKMHLPLHRIEEMVSAYGYSMSDFFVLSRSKKVPENKRTECLQQLKTIPNAKLQEVFNYLKSISRGE